MHLKKTESEEIGRRLARREAGQAATLHNAARQSELDASILDKATQIIVI